ncbi:TIGR02450 family Trp-rich protein [Marinomonas atlantica]|uniref:TIGR02450 family Trp-rich protein n=1 Tax=Marinomonas atlantica TaxID=1806668 RepID=UPI00082FA7A3|nr:TIGR02450 family Trp-rich protein [Marinomonas atlantica]MCO4785895.1 TIGR02450 family Trp-rich protein [Marinomonas atlantica]
MTKKLNPNKLLLSKWTSTVPKNKEKHFIVTRLDRDEDEVVIDIILEAVYTKNTYQLPWQALLDDLWQQGWH